MSEGSLPPFRRLGLRFSPVSLFRQALGRVSDRLRPRPAAERPDPQARSRAASAIRTHAETHATLFERAERLRARAERLDKEGTPSDSAKNRAERAEDEVCSSLADLRVSFAGSRGDPTAFDEEVALHYPNFKFSGGP